MSYFVFFCWLFIISGSGSITSVGEERACNYVVSVWRGFLFLWVLGMGYVILLWHSLSLPFKYFARLRGNKLERHSHERQLS